MNGLEEYVYVEDDTQAEMAVEYLSKFDRLGYDTETTGLNIVGGVAKLLLMQLGTEEITYVFDARKIDTEVLRPILESKKILKILHNAVFDYKITKKECGIWLTNVFDTMLSYRLLTSGYLDDGMGGLIPMGDTRPKRKQWPYKSLDFLCKKYLGKGLDKSVRSTFINFQYSREFTAKQIKYAAADVAVLHPLCDILGAELAAEGLVETALLEFEFVSAASEMELNGVYINKEKWRTILTACHNKAASVKEEIAKNIEHLSDQNTLFGQCTINIDSPSQLVDCFSKMGIEVESTDSKILKKLDDPLAKMVLEYRAYDKLTKTYGESLLARIERSTNRLHYSLLQLGTTTGRLSAEKPNIQNIPQDREDEEVSISFRECFEAEEGNLILTADYSQCELRILAEESGDKGFLGIFERGEDLHLITAQEVFGLTDSELKTYELVKKKDYPGSVLPDLFSMEDIAAYKKVSSFRSKTKTVNFGIVYGLSAWNLARTFKIPENEAEELLSNYFKTYSGIKRFLDKNGRETVINRFSKTILGRKRYYTLADPSDERAFRSSKSATMRAGNNQVIQGANADITKEALIRLQEAYRDIPGAKLLFTVHDEVVSEVPKDKAQEIADIKADIMAKAFHRFIKNVPVGNDDKVSVSIAPHWTK